MKRGKLDFFMAWSRQRSVQALIFIGLVYVLMVGLEVPFVFKTGFSLVSQQGFANRHLNSKSFVVESDDVVVEKMAPIIRVMNQTSRPERKIRELKSLSSLNFDGSFVDMNSSDGFSGILKSAKEAFEVGKKFWEDLELHKQELVLVYEKSSSSSSNNKTDECPHSISISGSNFQEKGRILVVPCGLTLGSSITIIGKPRKAHQEHDPKISLLKDGQFVMVSQFMMELQGLKTVDGEDPPRILHFNPRLKGDWSGKPVIEHNTCYRQQWGTAQRCDGWRSKDNEETVDGQVKCEKWIGDNDDNHSDKSKPSWWLNRLTWRSKRVTVDWPFPFAEDKLFVLTISAGFEGYHINVDGRHVTSFPYRTGFALEDATGLSLNGDIDVESVFAASLPATHPNFAPQRHLDMSSRWKAPPLLDQPVDLFIGILSAGNHFAERMAIRKSWMQHPLIRSASVVPRFFVALHARKEVNVELKKEADFFGDIVIVPYMDHYDLVVLKTVAICEYGVRVASAKNIMKCDDDTFVRVDAVIKEVNQIPENRSLYIGNINYHHKPLRSGKWAVTYELLLSKTKFSAMGQGEESKTRNEASVEVQERGEIFFFYRPKVGKQEAHDPNDVQRLYIVLRPESGEHSVEIKQDPHSGKEGEGLGSHTDPEKPTRDISSDKEHSGSEGGHGTQEVNIEKQPLLRFIVMGRKSLPDPSKKTGHRPYWGFVEMVTTKIDDVKAALKGEEYDTSTRGHRVVAPARAVGEGIYRILRHNPGKKKMHTHLVYKLEFPAEDEKNEPQEELNIKREGSFLIQIKNPDQHGSGTSSGFRGLQNKRKASFPAKLQGEFGQLRYHPADPPDFLNYEGCEFLLISASDDIEEELGLELKTETEGEAGHDPSCSDLVRTFGETAPVRALLRGTWV